MFNWYVQLTGAPRQALRSLYIFIEVYANSYALNPLSYLIGIFIHLKLCLADAIHNFKWLTII